MAIKYAIQQISRKGVTPGSSETKYYAHARYDDVTSQEDIAQMVACLLYTSSRCTTTDAQTVRPYTSLLVSLYYNGRSDRAFLHFATRS